MRPSDTSLGGGREAFPETAWSTILAHPDTPESRDRLTRLFADYWRPVYGFIRASGVKSVEDAKDLTQGFFVHVLDHGVVARYDRGRGRFRDFLKGSVRNYLSQERRAAGREKRGGGRTIVSIDVEGLETESFLADLRQRTPDELFDLQWAQSLLEDSLIRLRETLEAEGKGIYFTIYERYEMSPPDREAPTHQSVAQELGIKSHDVVNHLKHAKSKLENILLDRISGYVLSRQELIHELKDLFAR